jgi:predicted SprT family Zn-dependent metalloprotease
VLVDVRARLAGLLERCLGSRSLPPVQSRKIPAIRQAGRHFHLGAIFDRINRDCFEGAVTAAITWGRHSARRRRRSIRLGSYRKEQNLIRINPALDAEFVPGYVVEALVHHEMLHAVIPVRTGKNGRRVVHGRDFRVREREFHCYREAKEWTRKNIELLLRQVRPTRPRPAARRE